MAYAEHKRGDSTLAMQHMEHAATLACHVSGTAWKHLERVQARLPHTLTGPLNTIQCLITPPEQDATLAGGGSDEEILSKFHQWERELDARLNDAKPTINKETNTLVVEQLEHATPILEELRRVQKNLILDVNALKERVLTRAELEKRQKAREDARLLWNDIVKQSETTKSSYELEIANLRQVADFAFKIESTMFGNNEEMSRAFVDGKKESLVYLTKRLDTWASWATKTVRERQLVRSLIEWVQTHREWLNEHMKPGNNIIAEWGAVVKRARDVIDAPYPTNVADTSYADAIQAWGAFEDEYAFPNDELKNKSTRMQLPDLGYWKPFNERDFREILDDLLGTVRIFVKGLDRGIVDGKPQQQTSVSWPDPNKPVLEWNNETFGPFHGVHLPADNRNPTNKALYDDLSSTLSRLRKGGSITTLSYGFSGSGKTYSFFHDGPDDPGIVPTHLKNLSNDLASVQVYARELYGEAEDASVVFLTSMTGTILEYAHRSDVGSVMWKGKTLPSAKCVHVKDEKERFSTEDLTVVSTPVYHANLLPPDDPMYGVTTSVGEPTALTDAHQGRYCRLEDGSVGVYLGNNQVKLCRVVNYLDTETLDFTINENPVFMTGLLHDHLSPVIRTDNDGNLALADVLPFMTKDEKIRVVAPDGTVHALDKGVWEGVTRLTTYEKINYYKKDWTYTGGTRVDFESNATYLVQGWEAPGNWQPPPEQEFVVNTFQVEYDEDDEDEPPKMEWNIPTKDRTRWKVSHIIGADSKQELRTAVLCRVVEATSADMLTLPSEHAVGTRYKFRTLWSKGDENSVDQAFQKAYQTIDSMRKKSKRIMATPNNAESSRSHLFITLKLQFTSGDVGHWNIGDSAGTEDPMALAESAFQNNTDWAAEFRDKYTRTVNEYNALTPSCDELAKRFAHDEYSMWDIVRQSFFINESNHHLFAFCRKQDPQVKTWNVEHGCIDLGGRRTGKEIDKQQWFAKAQELVKNDGNVYTVRLYGKSQERRQSIPVCVSTDGHGELPQRLKTGLFGFLSRQFSSEDVVLPVSANPYVRGGEVFAELLKDGDTNAALRSSLAYAPDMFAQNPVGFVHDYHAVRLNEDKYATFARLSLLRLIDSCGSITHGGETLDSGIEEENKPSSWESTMAKSTYWRDNVAPFSYRTILNEMAKDTESSIQYWNRLNQHAIDAWDAWNERGRKGTEPARGFIRMVSMLQSMLDCDHADNPIPPKLVILQNVRTDGNDTVQRAVKQTLAFADRINPVSYQSVLEVEQGTRRTLPYNIMKGEDGKNELVSLEATKSLIYYKDRKRDDSGAYVTQGETQDKRMMGTIGDDDDKQTAFGPEPGAIIQAERFVPERGLPWYWVQDHRWRLDKNRAVPTTDKKEDTKPLWLPTHTTDGNAFLLRFPTPSYGPYVSTWYERTFPFPETEQNEEYLNETLSGESSSTGSIHTAPQLSGGDLLHIGDIHTWVNSEASTIPSVASNDEDSVGDVHLYLDTIGDDTSSDDSDLSLYAHVSDDEDSDF